MKIKGLLEEPLITMDLKVKEKGKVIEELVQLLVNAGKITSPQAKKEILQALLQREALTSTGIGYGVAIPHAKTDAVSDVLMAFGRSKEGVDFEALDGQPVYLFFLVVAATDRTNEYLKLLAAIASLLKSESVRKALQEAKTAKEVLELIHKHE